MKKLLLGLTFLASLTTFANAENSKEQIVVKGLGPNWTCIAQCGYGRFVRGWNFPSYTTVKSVSVKGTAATPSLAYSEMESNCKELTAEKINVALNQPFGSLSKESDRAITETQVFANYEATESGNARIAGTIKYVPVKLKEICINH